MAEEPQYPERQGSLADELERLNDGWKQKIASHDLSIPNNAATVLEPITGTTNRKILEGLKTQ